MDTNKSTQPKLYITEKARQDLQKQSELETEKKRLLFEAREEEAKVKRIRAEERNLEKRARKTLKLKLFDEALQADSVLSTNLQRLDVIDGKLVKIHQHGEKLEADYKKRCAQSQAQVDGIRHKISIWQEMLDQALFEHNTVVEDRPLTRSDIRYLTETRTFILEEIDDRLREADEAWKTLSQDGAYSHNAAKRARSKHRDTTSRRRAKTILQENDDG